MQKRRYAIRNWAEYSRALVQRGSITVWIEEESMKKWFSTSHTGKTGRPETYSNEAILMLLILRERFNLTLRSLQGFAISLFALMKVALPIPSYTQISRRAQSLHKRVRGLIGKGAKNQNLIFDSTGLKVYGEGEWKIKVHGKAKRRTWRKFHIGIDAETQDIVCVELTENNKGDAEVAERMLDKMSNQIKSVRGDGSYDAGHFRKKVHEKGGVCIVPPRRDATYKGAKSGWKRERDACLAEIEGFGGGEEGRKLWKKCSGYHERSLVETSMFRIKKLFGSHLKSRSLGSQQSESLCKCLIINKMNKLGLPKGKWIFKVG
jgi:transposase